MFWKRWNWPHCILIGLSLNLVACIIFLTLSPRAHLTMHGASCYSNLKQIGLAFVQYEQDYDEKFPLIITGSSAYGWADALQPYLKSTRIYQCPYDVNDGQRNPRLGGYTDYPFDVNLAGKSQALIDDESLQILSLDGNDGVEVTNARYCLTRIPAEWFKNQSSPLYRDGEAAHYLFADGHVKSYEPAQLSANKRLIF